jgi:tetratricopeptide (TPR) repeat protein
MARPCNAAYSNRAACHTQLGAFAAAIEDANRCIALEPAWGKGYSRKGLAELLTGQYAKTRPGYHGIKSCASEDACVRCHRDTVDLTILTWNG